MRIAIVNKDKMDKQTIDNINLKQELEALQEIIKSWQDTSHRRWNEILQMREASAKREQAILESRKEIEQLKHQVQHLTRKRNEHGKFVKQN